jgi:CheY-like chemotaxis protein
MTGARLSNGTLAFGEPKPKVLVADDEAYITETLQAILNGAGFEVATAGGGKEAVRKAREWRPDLVLSDVLMPDLDGIAASIQIVEFLPACRIVLFSGHGVVHDLLRTAHAHGYEFDLLLKPIHPLDLIQHLRGVLERG